MTTDIWTLFSQMISAIIPIVYWIFFIAITIRKDLIKWPIGFLLLIFITSLILNYTPLNIIHVRNEFSWLITALPHLFVFIISFIFLFRHARSSSNIAISFHERLGKMLPAFFVSIAIIHLTLLLFLSLFNLFVQGHIYNLIENSFTRLYFFYSSYVIETHLIVCLVTYAIGKVNNIKAFTITFWDLFCLFILSFGLLLCFILLDIFIFLHFFKNFSLLFR